VSETSVTGPGGRVLSITAERIRVDYMTDMDADWKFTDAAGHGHWCDYDGALHYPTLREVSDGTWWCEDCQDEHENTHLECRWCGETIRPGITGPGTRWLPGRQEYWIDGLPVTPAQAHEFLEQVRRLTGDSLAGCYHETGYGPATGTAELPSARGDGAACPMIPGWPHPACSRQKAT
jgi:hypothetical protein